VVIVSIISAQIYDYMQIMFDGVDSYDIVVQNKFVLVTIVINYTIKIKIE